MKMTRTQKNELALHYAKVKQILDYTDCGDAMNDAGNLAMICASCGEMSAEKTADKIITPIHMERDDDLAWLELVREARERAHTVEPLAVA